MWCTMHTAQCIQCEIKTPLQRQSLCVRASMLVTETRLVAICTNTIAASSWQPFCTSHIYIVLYQHTSDKDSFRMVKVGRELKVDIPWVIWYTITDELLLLSSSSDQDHTHSYTPFYMFFYWLTWRFVLFYPIPIIIIISYITLLSTHTYTHTVKHVHLFITEPVAQLVLACATQMAVTDYCPVYGCWTHQALLLIWSYMSPSSATHPNRP